MKIDLDLRVRALGTFAHADKFKGTMKAWFL